MKTFSSPFFRINRFVGRALKSFIAAEDVVESGRKESNGIKQLEIYVDSLSQIRNRRFLDEKLIYEPCHAVVMADIDLFKIVNDTAGHDLLKNAEISMK